MVPNVWTQRKAPPKRGQVYGSLRKKGYSVFHNWAIPSAGIGSFGENARHRSVATEQQIGRPARPYKKGTDENALYIA